MKYIRLPVLAAADGAVQRAFAALAHLHFGHGLAGDGVKEIGAVHTVTVTEERKDPKSM